MIYHEHTLVEQKLTALLKESVSPYHTVLAAQKRLQEAGFSKLPSMGSWELQAEGKYYVVYGGSTLFAFVLGKQWAGAKKLRIAAAHTDFPGFAIKSNPDIVFNGYHQLNVEVYGGPILNTWMDRPLSAAGQVVIKTENVWEPELRLVDIKKPFCIIPNLAVHMNREVNKGVALNRQTDLLPVTGLAGENMDKDVFLHFLAEEMQGKPEDILSYDLRLYCTEEPQYVGMKEEFLSACHLDNTTSVQALLDGIIAAGNGIEGIRLAAFFDHEEIGSKTKQGAGSMLMRTVLGKIGASGQLAGNFFADKMSAEELSEDAMMLSVDVAHAVHPNFSGKADPTNRPIPGKGFCIKEACAQSYATDSQAIAALKQLCDCEQIPWQTFVNRSDEAGGSTLGSVASSFLPIPTVDMGIGLLAMHSARELMGNSDMEALSRCICAFYTK